MNRQKLVLGGSEDPPRAPFVDQALRLAVEKAPARAAYHHHLGLALAKNGDTAGARLHLSKALELQPDFDGAAECRQMLDSLGTR